VDIRKGFGINSRDRTYVICLVKKNIKLISLKIFHFDLIFYHSVQGGNEDLKAYILTQSWKSLIFLFLTLMR
jgi:hypothetical protein